MFKGAPKGREELLRKVHFGQTSASRQQQNPPCPPLEKGGYRRSFSWFQGVPKGRENLRFGAGQSDSAVAPSSTRHLRFGAGQSDSAVAPSSTRHCLEKTSDHLQRRKPIHLVIDRSRRENSKSSLNVAAPISGNMMSTVQGMNRETFTISPHGSSTGKGSLTPIIPVLPRSNAALIPSGRL